MSWIEKEVQKVKAEKERQLREQESIALKENIVREENHIRQIQMEKFWSRLIAGNSELPSEVRLEVIKNRMIMGKGMTLIFHDVIISNSETNSEADTIKPSITFFYNLEAKRFSAKIKNRLYDIDMDSIDTILRNLCTGRDIAEDLKVNSGQKAIERKAKCFGVVILFFIAALVIVFAVANSELLLSIIIAIPLLYFINKWLHII